MRDSHIDSPDPSGRQRQPVVMTGALQTCGSRCGPRQATTNLAHSAPLVHTRRLTRCAQKEPGKLKNWKKQQNGGMVGAPGWSRSNAQLSKSVVWSPISLFFNTAPSRGGPCTRGIGAFSPIFPARAGMSRFMELSDLQRWTASSESFWVHFATPHAVNSGKVCSHKALNSTSQCSCQCIMSVIFTRIPVERLTGFFSMRMHIVLV